MYLYEPNLPENIDSYSCFDVIFVIWDAVNKPTVDVRVLEVMKGSVLSSRLRNDDTVWTLHFKLILTETWGFEFPLRWLE